VIKHFIGACHADELSYLFYGKLFGFTPKPNSPELRMCQTLSKLWTNFAKTGLVLNYDQNIDYNILLSFNLSFSSE